jgi:hypothetical protein
MASMTRTSVPITNFLRKKVRPAEAPWQEIDVSLHCSMWGVKASEAVGTDGTKFFIYPLTITEVVEGGEGAQVGIQVGDIVVEINSIKVTTQSDLVDLPSEEHKPVSVHIQRLLYAGGVCQMKIMRNTRQICCTSCGSKDVIEVIDRGDLVCQACGVVVRCNIAFVGMNWENDSTTCVESSADVYVKDQQVLTSMYTQLRCRPPPRRKSI